MSRKTVEINLRSNKKFSREALDELESAVVAFSQCVFGFTKDESGDSDIVTSKHVRKGILRALRAGLVAEEMQVSSPENEQE